MLREKFWRRFNQSITQKNMMLAGVASQAAIT